MTVFYLDFEGGNDANDGTTFANRWKTIGSGATMDRIAPGDTVRIMASPDPVSPGTATWTDNSGTVAWAANKNKVIDNGEVPWTASSIYIAAETSTIRKQGEICTSIRPVSSFTTGKAAYRNLTALPATATASNRTGAIVGTGSLTLIQDASADNASILVTLPFSVTFQGTSYTDVYVGSNGYVTFGTGSTVTSVTGSSPPYPTIAIDAGNRSYQRVYAGSEDGNATYRIRYEGASGTSGTPGSSTVFWELLFTAATPGVIELDIGANAASGLGFSGITNGAGTILTRLEAGTVSTGYTITSTAPSTGAALDLSAFQQVSFWFRHGALVTAGQVELKLCSDTAGDTAVHTIPIPAGVNGQWRLVVFDNGAALSSGISSIAVHTTADPGTTAFMLDNIVACHAPGSSNCVTHAHVIGKNTVDEPEWYSILSIADNGIVIGGARAVTVGSAPMPPVYRGVSETVATHVQAGIDITGLVSNALVTTQDDGTADLPITFTCGWNRTDMSTLTGKTYLNGMHYRSIGLLVDDDWIVFRGLGGFYFTTVLATLQVANNIDLSLEQVVGTTSGPFYETSNLSGFERYAFTYVHGATGSFVTAVNNNGAKKIFGRRIHGSRVSLDSAITLRHLQKLYIDRIDNNAGYGFFANIGNETFAIHGATFANNASGDIRFITSGTGQLNLNDCTYTGPINTTGSGSGMKITSTRDGAPNVHRTQTTQYLIESDATVRHTASGVSWRSSLTTTHTYYAPMRFSLAKVLCTAGSPATVKCWLRRNSADLALGIVVEAGELPGIGNADLSAYMTAAVDTWEEVSLTFTPTQTGVVEVWGSAWGAASTAGWFDDLTLE